MGQKSAQSRINVPMHRGSTWSWEVRLRPGVERIRPPEPDPAPTGTIRDLARSPLSSVQRAPCLVRFWLLITLSSGTVVLDGAPALFDYQPSGATVFA
jgi:hypothetical protein